MNISNEIDWVALKTLADKQGLTAVILDGVNEVLKTNPQLSSLNSQLKLLWIGEVMQNYERRYAQYEKAISSLAGFYNQQGFKMMVLKGYACSLDWPKPNHRPCGDIDIWQYGKQKEADLILSKETGLNIDDSHEHHTIFDWQGFMVENHYDFIDIHHRKSSSELEKIFKELGSDDSGFKDVNGEKVYLPSPNLHALFLLRHMMEHFASTELTLRQLLDWAFFVKKHGKDVDWKWLERNLDEFGMTPAYNIFNSICVEDLGFDALLFPARIVDATLKERVLCEIFQPEFAETQPSGLIPRIIFKFRRWKANEWKNEICFKESMWSAFWSGVWGHILKPSQI
ncbi:MAG: nucleotidyltransferase family protein [Bacteroidaceae bacterium]|nr:nucleotidyltransferase family protein [Bacteroidaceae bacterium]